MDLTSGYPFSLVRYGLPFIYPKLMTPVTTDVVIIGGGISGALTAYHLNKAGIDCIVVDGRSIGLGSTCASTSLLQYEIDIALHELANKVGQRNAVRAYQLCKEAIHKLGVLAATTGLKEFQYNKSLYYAALKKDRPFLEKEYEARKRNGFRVDFMEPSDIQAEFHFTAPAAILSYDAAYADAYLFTHALHQSAIRNGLRVYDRTSIKRVERNKRNVALLTGDGVSIKARKIVYATGYEVAPLLPKRYCKLLSTYVTISEHMQTRPEIMTKDVMLWSTGNPYLYIRRTVDGRMITGGRDEAFFNPGKRDALIKKKSVQLVADFHRLFPDAEFRSEFSWAGTFGATPDGLPFIGTYRRYPHSYFALGFGGNGITFSLIAAEIVTDLILKKNNRDATIFSFDRLK